MRANGNAPCTFDTDQMQIFVDYTPTATTNASQTVCETDGGATLQGNTGGTDLNNGATGFWTFPTAYREDFNDLADGTTSDVVAGSDWTRAVASTGGGYRSEVLSNRFESRGRVRTTWTSGTININALTDVGISLDFSSYAPSGNGFESPQDYYTITYYVDGTPTVMINGNGAVDGTTAGASMPFKTVNLTASGINGNNLVIEAIMYNSANDEIYYLDNIVVTEGDAPVIADPTDPTSAVTNLPLGSTVFTWTVSSANGACSPDVATHTITVEPELLPGAISGDQSICLGDNPVAFSSDTPASGGAAPISYQWYHRVNAGGWNTVGGNSPTYTAPNTLIAGTHEYYREAISASGVCGPVQTGLVEIIVNPGPTAQTHVIAGDVTKCEDESITLNYAAVTNATEYVWDFSWVAGAVNATTATPQITIDLSIYTFASPSQAVTISAAGINGCNVLGFDYPWSANHNLTVYQNPTADAGSGGDECDQDFILNATASVGTGTWTMTSGTGIATFVPNAITPGATVTVSQYGTKEFTWTEDNGGCTDSDVITVNFYEQPIADAGSNDDECDLDYVLNATASVGTGTWTMTSGGGTASFAPNANTPGATVTVSSYGTKEFTWTEVNGTCSDNDVVTINFYEQPVADAGAGGDECDYDFDLNATASVGTGTWTMTSGTGIATFVPNANTPGATVTVSQYGTKEFTWTEVNGTCSDNDAVTVNFYEQPAADAGSGGDECDYDFDLNATSSVGTGTWTMTSGTGIATFVPNANTPGATVTVSQYGTKEFTWTEVNGTCSDNDAVTVNFYEQPVADAGSGGDECDFDFDLNATASVGTGTWTMTSGTGIATFVPNANTPGATVTVSLYGTKEFTWTEDNGGCTDSDVITVNFYEQPVTNAGSGGNECDFDFILSATSSVGTGTWTMTSGTGIATFVPNANTPGATVTVSQYGTKEFTWTEVNGTCSDNDAVTVNFYEQPVADAGIGGDECDQDFLLNATASVGTGTWTMTSGTGIASFAPNANTPGATVTVSQYGTKEFTWTEVNGTCSDAEAINVTFYEAPTVSVNPVADVCLDSNLVVIPISGNFGGGASSATWSIITGNGSFQNVNTVGNSVTAEYVPTYADITAGLVTLQLRTDDPFGPCTDAFTNLSINIDEAVYVVIDQAPSVFIAEGSSANLSATISGAGGTVTQGVWTEVGALTGGTFAPSNLYTSSNIVTFTPTAAQEAAGGVTLRLTSFDPGTSCGPAIAEIQIIIGANPIADAGPDIEDCEPADSLIYLTGYAKASAGDANWSIVTGNGTITTQTKTWSVPQSAPDHDELDSLLVEAIYKLAPSDYGTPSTSSLFQFSLTTDDPDGAGPVSDDTDDMNYTVHWGPHTPAIGGGGLANMCVDTYGQFYSVPLTPGNTYVWDVEVLTGGGVPGTDYTIVGGGTGFNFIAIDWFTEATYNLKVTETTYLSDLTTPCIGEEVVLPIAVYPEPVVTAGSDATICLGETHVMNSSVTDGSGTYLYEWTPTTGLSSPNIPNPTVTGLFTGTFDYFLKVTDLISGCESVSGMVTITIDPLPVQYTLTGPSYYCSGAATGVTLTLSDSETDVYYQLMNGAVTVGPAVLGDGNPITWLDNFDGSYYVEAVRDAIPACSQTMAGVVNVTANPLITMATDLVVDVECNGSNEGAIQITPGGGTSPYTFLWSGPGVYSSTNEDITGLYAGDYTVTITDARGCTYVSPDITVNEPAQLVLTSVLETQAVTCYGGSDGEAEVIVDAATGTAPYNFQWYYDMSFSSPIVGATTSTLVGVPAATYYILVTDSYNCTVSGSVVVTEPSEITGSGAQTAPVSCNGSSDAEITITAAGGSGTLEYDLNGADAWQASNIFSGLGAGTYTLRVRDQLAPVCVVNLADVIITEPDVLTAVISSTDVSCFNANDGNITFNSSAGGYGTYEYSVDGGTIWQASPIFNGLAPGFYNLMIRDAAYNTCEITIDAAYEITEPAELSANIASTDVTCFSANDGTITISGAAGGYGTYEYSINAGLSWQASGNYTGLSQGFYDIRIRDAVNTGCVIVLDGAYEITQPAVLYADLASTDVTCNGADDGTITLTNPTGGYGTYEYTIDGGLSWQVSGNFAGLAPGFYNVRIRDAVNTGCEITLNALLQITEPSSLTATVAGTDISCNGASDGEINITNPNGGYGTYEYSIDGGTSWQVSGAFAGLAPGFYDVRIRDAAFAACEITLEAALELTEPAVLDAVVSSVDVTCNLADNGIISFSNPTGGYGTYQFTVDGGTTWSSSGSFTGLAPGFYDVRIRDAANTGCEITLDGALEITEPAILNADLASTNITCYGSADGVIDITNPTGGYGTYEYSINGGGAWQASGNFTGLAPGSYNVKIRDAAFTGCVITLDPAYIITQPAQLNATITPTNVSCNGANDGIIDITAPTGGYGTYEYTIDGGTTWLNTGTFAALTPGSYDVRIRDAVNTGCEVVLNSSLSITEPAALTAVISSNDITCFGANNGSIVFNSASGGYGTYEFTIDGGTTWQSSTTFAGLLPGFYDLRIRDAAHTGCEIILDAAYEITEPAVLFANVASTDITCFGSNNGTITLSGATGGYGSYAYSINGGATWQSSDSFTGLAPGFYDVRIRDAAFTACEITLDGLLEITQPDILAASLASTDITCYGADDGTITISSPTGGYGTYEYTVDGGTTWQVSGNFIALSPGYYNVRMRDAANPGCELTLNSLLRISEPGELSAAISSSDITCNGANDGIIILSNPIGGYGTYEYTIDGGTTWQIGLTFNGLAPGLL